ncbi:hypothetical protein O4159_12925 [Gordonia terrae]|nr:hypothetical protein [Gordonia terrae]
MTDWGESSGLNIGGVFEGSMKSEGTGARVKLGINMPFGLPDIPLVNKNVGGLAKGGVIGQSRAQAMESQAARRGGTRVNRPRGGMTTSEARGRGPGPRQGGADAPTGRRSGGASGSSSGHVHGPTGGGGGGPVHPLAAHARGAAGGGQRRRKHEIAPGVPCPSCATGITKPVR